MNYRGFHQWEPVELIVEVRSALRLWMDEFLAESSGDDDLPVEVRCLPWQSQLIFIGERLIVQLRMWKCDPSRAYAFLRWVATKPDRESAEGRIRDFLNVLHEAHHEADAQWRLMQEAKGERGGRAAFSTGSGGGQGLPSTDLERSEGTILHILRDAPRLLNQIEIAEATDSLGSEELCLSVGTVKKCLKSMKKAGLVHNPKGERKGYGLTDKGRFFAEGHFKQA